MILWLYRAYKSSLRHIQVGNRVTHNPKDWLFCSCNSAVVAKAKKDVPLLWLVYIRDSRTEDDKSNILVLDNHGLES